MTHSRMRPFRHAIGRAIQPQYPNPRDMLINDSKTPPFGGN